MDKSALDLKTRVMVEKIEKSRNMFPVELRHHGSTINMVTFNKTETLLASCSNDNHINVYNAVNYEIVNRFDCKVAVKYVFFIAKTDEIIAATALGGILIFDTYKFQEEQAPVTFTLTDFRLFDIKLSYGDKFIGVIWNYMFADDDFGDARNKLALYDLSKIKRPLTLTPDQLVEQKIIGLPETPFTKFIFYFRENIVYLNIEPGIVHKYDLSKSSTEPQLKAEIMQRGLNSFTFSPHFEFLIAAGNEAVKLLDPEDLSVFRRIDTKYPVLCGQMSRLLYDSTPRFHLFFAGGVPARDQAQKSEGGNEIYIYNIANEDKISELTGTYGNVNWITLFRDGSGFVTAGEEAIARIYRFDKCYYDEPTFK